LNEVILGFWLNNLAHGKGRFYHVDGDIYEGEWEKDRANGYGVYIHTNGARYEGQWREDLQHGFGIEKCKFLITNLGVDGSSYEGFYVDGRKEGKGKYIWSDKS
jgi:hypothetical protein